MSYNQCPSGQLFLKHSAQLLEQYRKWLQKALDLLPEDRLWWSPAHGVNSVGILLKHMRGNLRQWIVSGLGEVEFQRDRENEFKLSNETLSQLWNALDKTISEAIDILNNLDEQNLCRKLVIQGFTITGLEAIYHAIEHFAYHTGQIIYITKALTGKDLKFYVIGEDGNPKPNW